MIKTKEGGKKMKAREVVLEIFKKSGITNASLAHRVNMSITSSWDMLWNPKRTKDMSTKLLVPTLQALDYKVVVVPRDTKVPDDWYVID